MTAGMGVCEIFAGGKRSAGACTAGKDGFSAGVFGILNTSGTQVSEQYL
jgi:hypothetical protein